MLLLITLMLTVGNCGDQQLQECEECFTFNDLQFVPIRRLHAYTVWLSDDVQPLLSEVIRKIFRAPRGGLPVQHQINLEMSRYVSAMHMTVKPLFLMNINIAVFNQKVSHFVVTLLDCHW